MKSRVIALLITAVAVTTLLSACGDDDSTATPDAATAAGTKEPGDTTATDQATGPVITAPALADPQLDEQLTEVARGDLGEVEIPVGGVYYIDPATLAAQAGDVPSCDNFQFAFAWQVADPYPPDAASLEWELQRDGGNVTLSRDPAGEQSVGCDSLQAANQGDAPITLSIKYAIGGLP